KMGKAATAAAGAVVAALRALNVERIALATPYVRFVNEAEVRFLERHGFKVTSVYCLETCHTQEERRAINRVPPETIMRMAREADRPNAQAIFISCTALATIGMIDELEKTFAKPVVTSNQASFWSCLRLVGVKNPICGYGRVHSACLDP